MIWEGKREMVESEPGLYRHTEITGEGFKAFELTSLLPKTGLTCTWPRWRSERGRLLSVVCEEAAALDPQSSSRPSLNWGIGQGWQQFTLHARSVRHEELMPALKRISIERSCVRKTKAVILSIGQRCGISTQEVEWV